METAILYSNFFDHDGTKQLIGGVETYLLNLATLCQEMGMHTTIYQWANQPFERDGGGFSVKGVPVCTLPFRRRNSALFKYVTAQIDPNRDILIFGADHKSVRTDNARHILIQHGVSWDLPPRSLSLNMLCRCAFGAGLKKIKARRDAVRKFENCYNRVCVDYNFFNWYRTMVSQPRQGQTWIIPNFSATVSSSELVAREDCRLTKVLFARRFVEFRGTRLFARVAKRILEEFTDVEFTFAGEGPDRQWLEAFFSGEKRVTVTRYLPNECKRVLMEHHVAVIPSLASEGTSLSVAEAMGTGCPVIATCVGGITNMIIDEFNGLLAMPNEPSVYKCLRRLIGDIELRRRLGTQGLRCARASFGYDIWKDRWKTVFAYVAAR